MNATLLQSPAPKPFSKELDPALCYESRGTAKRLPVWI